jgi:hypothetical protein
MCKDVVYAQTERADHRAHRVATVAFWRTFDHEGKISPAWWGGGGGARPLPFTISTIINIYKDVFARST